MNRNSAQSPRGFTLVEMLVVIVITALTAMLVMQGIGQGLGVYQRVRADQGELYRELMCRDWLRQVLGAAVPGAGGDRSEGGAGDPGTERAPAGDPFSGDARHVFLVTLRPLLGSEGIPTPIELALGEDGALEYREGAQSVRISVGAPVVQFAFADDAGAWHERWPSDAQARLPARIRLGGHSESMDIAVLTRRSPETRVDAATVPGLD